MGEALEDEHDAVDLGGKYDFVGLVVLPKLVGSDERSIELNAF